MNKEDLLKMFDTPETTPGLRARLDYVESKIRPAVDIVFLDKAAALGESHLGGRADLPADVPWPTHQYGPYCFIGQINFA